MAISAKFGSLPFRQQIAFFRQKVNVPTQTWTDLFGAMHAQGFAVAGAAKQSLLDDLRRAIEKAIADGTTLETFRNDFDQIVKNHGWAYNGGRNWRTRVIYENNLRSSYAAGRYQQLQEVKAIRPYWRYKHSELVAHPRPQHKAWDGMVLAADDPFWDTHYPPNGWGCRCTIEPLGERHLRQMGKSGPDIAPEIKMRTVTVGARGPNPRQVEVPEGIDAGWAHNIGAAWLGQA